MVCPWALKIKFSSKLKAPFFNKEGFGMIVNLRKNFVIPSNAEETNGNFYRI